MRKLVVILNGVPGSGKGMQADLIADRLGLIHVDTGKLLRAILSDESGKNDPILKRERKFNDNGILNTPSWVTAMLKKKISAMAKLGYGIVFSGSPRTLYEAEGLVPFIEKLYGKKNVYFINLKVPFVTAAKRNSVRLVCTTCRRPLLSAFYPSKNPRNCPVCGGMLERRVDDDPLKFKTRTEEYEKRTMPILKYMKDRSYKIIIVDGTPAPYKVFDKINVSLKNRKGN
ncbi:MAG: nucleoside monophosphate kinase [Candidatus Liptonbacteria bacterium]|nr:nucleoside monophosphate kinase [Candidatus Liptonbacteria bacterium]